MALLNVAGKTEEKELREPAPAPGVAFEARMELARHFIRGSGLEIGALHGPLDVPPEASVTYVDRMDVEELRGHYPEVADLGLAPVDIVDDGERLTTVPDESQDFIIANHFLEHCEDPIGTIGSHLRKLKPGGVLFYAVPDKRYTFDFRRPVTPLEHMISDHEQGPERSRSEHYEEWVRIVGNDTGPGAEDRARELDAAGYSIHMHVWTQAEFLELLLHCQRRFDNAFESKAFEIEEFARRSIEVVAVLRKAGHIAQPGQDATNSGAAANSDGMPSRVPRSPAHRREHPRLASNAARMRPTPASVVPQKQLGSRSEIPLASLCPAPVGGWPQSATWNAERPTDAVRALAQPCGSVIVFPLRLAPGTRLRARISLATAAPGPLVARAQVSVREPGGTETTVWSRILASVGRRPLPPSIRVDAPLGDAAGDVDLVLSVTAFPRGGAVLWREAVVNLTAPLAPPLPELRRNPDRPASHRPRGDGPLISVLTPVHDPAPNMLVSALASVRRQTFGAWELCLVDDGSRDPRVIELLDAATEEDPRIRLVRREQSGGIARATNDALEMASGEYVACVDHDDLLVDEALATMAAAIGEHPDADVLYSDEELTYRGRRFSLALKPGWSPDLLRSTMYLCHLSVYRRSLALEVGGYRPEFDGSQDYDLALRITERSDRIVHVPGALYRWRIHEHSAAGSEVAKPYAYSAARRALAEHLERTKVDGDVHFGVYPGLYRVVHRVPRDTRAAMIVPVPGDAAAMADAVAQAADSWASGDLRPRELVLVGPPAVLSACAERLPPGGPAGRLVRVEALPGDGVATLMKAGASAVDSDYLVLCEGPVQSLTRDWLERLAGFAGQPGVAAAGAKMLTRDGRVEHVGVMVSGGLPLSVLQGADPSEPGPVGIGRVPCNLSAVRGVVATPRETFVALGGIDEHLGSLALIDFCLRAREGGRRIVSVPDVIMRDLRQSPPSNDLPALHAFSMRWRSRLGRDPFFNPGFYPDRADFALRPGV